MKEDVQKGDVLPDVLTDSDHETDTRQDDPGPQDSKDDGVKDTDAMDTNVPDTNVPDTNVPDTNVPDTNVPDTNVPDTNVPDTNVPDIGGQDTKTCIPNCDGLECGPDPICQTECGPCSGSDVCVEGECVWQEAQHSVKCSDGMCLISAGSFWMGCNATVDDWCRNDEEFYHLVMLSGYYMDKTEVTVDQYAECVTLGGCTPPYTGTACNWEVSGRGNHPVNCLDSTQAACYCAWAGKRLPTEAEWEKAARGTDGRNFPWGNEMATCQFAVMGDGDNNGCGTHSTWDVCSMSPAGDSPYGLCDMSGNVSEWVSDWYDSGYYTNSPTFNPTGPVSGSTRVFRGGGFTDEGYNLTSAGRAHTYPSLIIDNMGFRCVRPQ